MKMAFNEKHLVEDYIIKQLEGKGWRFIPGNALERESYEEPLLIPTLVRALKRINKESGIGNEEINKALNELKLTGTGIEGAKRILNFYKFGIPVKFEKEKVPIIGDDIKSQIGATIVHRTLTKLCVDRGAKIKRTYQINVGGNTDFLNMLERKRLESKKVSKTEAVRSLIPGGIEDENIYVGPSDFIPFLGNTKLAFIRIEGTMFADVPFSIELRLEVDDKANSAGVAIDAVRYCKLALDRNIGGPLIGPSAWLMKHPPVFYSDEEARKLAEDFEKGLP